MTAKDIRRVPFGSSSYPTPYENEANALARPLIGFHGPTADRIDRSRLHAALPKTSRRIAAAACCALGRPHAYGRLTATIGTTGNRIHAKIAARVCTVDYHVTSSARAVGPTVDFPRVVPFVRTMAALYTHIVRDRETGEIYFRETIRFRRANSVVARVATK